MSIEAMKQALELLRKKEWESCDYTSNASEAAELLEKAIATEESSNAANAAATQRSANEHLEPVAWRTKRNGAWSYHANEVHGVPNEPVYTHPQPAQPKCKWVGLTDEDKDVSNLAYSGASVDYMDGYECGMEAAEAKLKEKNT